MSKPLTSPWTARPDGSGRWDSRIAAQHLPRDLVRPSSELKELRFPRWWWRRCRESGTRKLIIILLANVPSKVGNRANAQRNLIVDHLQHSEFNIVDKVYRTALSPLETLHWFCVCMIAQLRAHCSKRLLIGLPDGPYFTANSAEAGKRPVFWKSVPEAGIVKINNLP